MISKSTYSFIMSKLYDIKGHSESPEVSDIKDACEKFIRASYNFIFRNYGENLTDESLKAFSQSCELILKKLDIQYQRALVANYQRSQNKELAQKTKAIDIQALIHQHCLGFQKATEHLLYCNLSITDETKPVPKAK